MKKDRGILLTILIILIGLSYIFGLVDSLKYSFMYNTLLSILGLISLVGIWLWKKWAVYLFIVMYAVSFGITLFLLQTPQLNKDLSTFYSPFVVWMIAWGIIPVVLGYIALKAKWKYFN